MWPSKKFVLVPLLAVVVLVGSIGGVAFAQKGNGGEDPRPKPDRGHRPGPKNDEGYEPRWRKTSQR